MTLIDTSTIKELAHKVGFSLCGITSASAIAGGEEHLRRWLSLGYGAPLGYMQRNIEMRANPSLIHEGARSVIICAMSYKSEASLKPQEPKIASYALMRDYHKSIKRLLKQLLRLLKEHYPDISARIFTDSAPLLEKQLAQRAGLGWIGRQSLLITPEYGSYILLGEIVVDAEASEYDSPFVGERCGECRRCVVSCPVGAINGDRTIDTRRCISSRTVEMECDSSSLSLNGWIFGCDECQICCPHNQLTPLHHSSEFDPIVIPPSKGEWMAMSEEDFAKFSASTPLRRSNLCRIRRNLIER